MMLELRFFPSACVPERKHMDRSGVRFVQKLVVEPELRPAKENAPNSLQRRIGRTGPDVGVPGQEQERVLQLLRECR